MNARVHHDEPALAAAKKAMRARMVERRRVLRLQEGPQAGNRLRDVFAAHVRLGEDAVVAGFSPMGDEIDVLPLLEWLAAAGRVTALPVADAPGQPLTFRRWRPGEALEAGPHGTRHPPASAPAATPTVVLVPLLAFDNAGFRLGYGGGYYDRSIALLRRRGSLLAVGVAFEGQRVEAVPRGAHDQALDAVATERRFRWIERGDE